MDQALEGIQSQNIVPQGVLPGSQDVKQEKVLTQSEVNDLIGRTKHASYEKGKRDALAEHSTNQPSQADNRFITDDDARKMFQEEVQKQAQLEQVKHTLNNFANQWNQGKEKYSDFDEKVAKLGNLENLPHIVSLATETGMAGDIMRELGDNPHKVATLTTLAYINPELAKAEMKTIADSIKLNDRAANVPQANEPLSQMKHSGTATKTDSGAPSMKDLRRKWVS